MALIWINFCCSAEADPQGILSMLALSLATISRAPAEIFLLRRTMQSLTVCPFANEDKWFPERRI